MSAQRPARGADGVEAERVEMLSFDEISDRGVRSEQRPVFIRRMTSEEYAEVDRLRSEAGLSAGEAAATPPGPTPTEQALAHASSLASRDWVELTVSLEEVDFDFSAFRAAEDAPRAQLVEQRKAQLRGKQDGAARAIEAMGGEVVGRMWLVNQLHVRIPAERARALSQLPGVTALSLDGRATPGGWGGRKTRAGMMLDGANLSNSKKDFYQGCFSSPADPAACHDGTTFSKAGGLSRQRLAIVEAPHSETSNDMINRNHVGWKDSASSGASNRVIAAYECSTSACTLKSTSGGGVDNHGTRVSWVAAGSIEQGQDSNYPLSGSGARTNAQRDRSGIAKEPWILYFIATSDALSALKLGIEQAVGQGADVINLSWGSGVCSSVTTYSYDESGLNAALRAATDSGALIVGIAHNLRDNDGGTCRIRYPAWRPEVLSVGGLDSRSTSSDMNTLAMWKETPPTDDRGSARGGATLRIAGSTTNRTFSGVDLVAPACIGSWFSNDSNGYSSGERCGTSYSAPAVAGIATLFRDALGHTGQSTAWRNDARRLLADMLLFGDGWDSDSNTKWEWGASKHSGFGRVHAHWPSTTNLAPPWLWVNGTATVLQGNTLSWDVGDSSAESSSITQLKWAVTWFDSNLGSSSDITIDIVDACDDDRVISTDLSFDFRKRIRMPSSKIGGKCLKMRVQATKTPTAGTKIYSSFYYHSGSNADTQH